MGITVLLFFMLYMLDQILKFIINKRGVGNPIIWGTDKNSYFVKFDLVYNKGAAFGMGSGSTVFLTILSFVATIALIIICTKFINWRRNKTQGVALVLLLSGCVGNLFDRFMTSVGALEGVIDMIYFKPFEWIMDLFHFGYGVFNLADFYLVTGIILFAFDFIFFSERKKKKWEKSL